MAVTQSQPSAEQSHAWARAATSAAVIMAATLCLIKAVAWWVTGSAAVLGSLTDSGLDLFGSVAAALAVRYAATPPDHLHRYGHYKAEALTAIGQVALIIALATIVAWESIGRLIRPAPIQSPEIAVWVLSAALVATVALVAFQTLAIRRSGSLIVQGDRAHYLSDVFLNGSALLAVVIGTRMDWPRADAMAGLLAVVFLVLAGWQVVKRALPELMDQELPPKDHQLINELLSNDPDVFSFHALRTRQAGGRRFIQVDIQILAEQSFRSAHAISDRVEVMLEQAFPDADVIVHADPAGEARLERRAIEAIRTKIKRRALNIED
ncbi:MAG: cation diffusion facilitator family transporter [Pseudomonadota bacterium]